MDDSNPAIQFDPSGQCNCCRDALHRKPHEWWPGEEGVFRTAQLVASLKEQGRGKEYDVMVGLSGGVDSSYLAHLASRKYGLRVLAVHVDGGWNSEAAVRNIEVLVRQLQIDLYTYVVEWREMKDLQVAFLRSSVLNQDIPQDHAFFATLYRTAAHFGIRHFLSGVNFTSESIVPPQWGYPSMDGKHARAIHRRFGEIPLESFPIMGLMEYLWITRVRHKLAIHRPLDYMNYDKERAIQELKDLYGWQDYGGKHHESRFTKFYQEIYLPRKFGFDKRRLHLSSLIVAGQISRDSALKELERPLPMKEETSREIRFVAKKLGITTKEVIELIGTPAVDHLQYPNGMRLHTFLMRVRDFMRERTQQESTNA